MPKYTGAYMQDLDLEEEEEVIATENDNAAPPSTPEDESWKKRYGDLRRHADQTKKQLEDQISALRNELDTATKSQIKFPKTEEEVAEWMQKYPEVAGIVQTIAKKAAMDEAGSVSARLDELKSKIQEAETRMTQAQAEAVLHELHPDFPQLKADPEFHAWLKTKSQRTQDSLYDNATDPYWAAETISLYKAENGGKRKAPAQKDVSAAESVGRGSRSAPNGGDKTKWSESRVERLTAAEFERYEDEITEAIRSGTFIYDLKRR